ncbi:MAG: mannose-6-phosphate isomerase [uncultured bacterium]|nr:MAG: mannose-6-phosphate isomerase [uncultured bacterium]
MINEIGKIYIRPWGAHQTLVLADNYQVKIITVNSGGRLSLQKHSKRSEHWVVVAGSPTITVDDMVKVYQVNDHVFIPVGAVHRIENLTDMSVIVVETQYGSYLGEDDIIRLDDVYGRI